MANFRALSAIALALASSAAFLTISGADAQTPDGAPVVIYESPEDGDVLGEAPFVLQLCFEEPINIKDLDKGGDFNFSLINDQGLGLGLRIVFQPDGFGVAVYPGPQQSPLAPLPTDQERPWVFEYRVTDPETLDPTEDEITFTVDETAEPIPSETPPACAVLGPTTDPIVSQQSPGATRTPDATGETEPADGSPEATPDEEDGVEEEDDDDDADILTLALLTIGAAGVAGGLLLIAYFISRRIGLDPHGPDSGGDTPPERH